MFNNSTNMWFMHYSDVKMAFVRGIHRWPVNCPYKGSEMRKMVPFDDVIMEIQELMLGFSGALLINLDKFHKMK